MAGVKFIWTVSQMHQNRRDRIIWVIGRKSVPVKAIQRSNDPTIQRSNDPAIQQKASVRRLVAFEDTGGLFCKISHVDHTSSADTAVLNTLASTQGNGSTSRLELHNNTDIPLYFGFYNSTGLSIPTCTSGVCWPSDQSTPGRVMKALT